MSSHPIEEKLLPAFAKFLFKRYVEKFGYSKACLNKYEIPITISYPPADFFVETPDGKKMLCVQYLSEMKVLGLLTQDGGFYKFTDEGYLFGYEALHPYKTFHKRHWQWIYGSLLALGGIIVSLIQLCV
jgi:hypothetical protein